MLSVCVREGQGRYAAVPSADAVVERLQPPACCLLVYVQVIQANHGVPVGLAGPGLPVRLPEEAVQLGQTCLMVLAPVCWQCGALGKAVDMLVEPPPGRGGQKAKCVTEQRIVDICGAEAFPSTNQVKC